MPKVKSEPVTVRDLSRMLSSKTITFQAVSEIRFQVRVFGMFVGHIQKINNGWAHFTGVGDRIFATQEEAAKSLARLAFNRSPDFYLDRIKL
jgi:hypothetical protein